MYVLLHSGSNCSNSSGISIASSDPKTQNTSDTEPDDDEGHDKTDPDLMFSVLISIKGFLKFLNSHVLSSTTIACKACSGYVVIVSFRFKQVSANSTV
jgi:hypothetical protein